MPATTATWPHSARRRDGIGRRGFTQGGHHEHDDRGTRQQGQQVIADRDPGQIHDEEKKRSSARGVPRCCATRCSQPAHRGDGEGRDGVDLGLVRVLPVGEGEGAEQCGRGTRRRCGAPCPPRIPMRRISARKDSCATRKKQPAPSALSSALRRLVRNAYSPIGNEHGPDVRNHHEEWRPGGMRNAEHLRGGDELARIPERDRRSEREHDNPAEPDHVTLPIRRPVFRELPGSH